MNFQEHCIVMLKESEGCVPHMYLDTKGLVTVGVGNLLRTVEDAYPLTFIEFSSQQSALTAEIEADFDLVKVQVPDRVASYYRQFTNLDLSTEDIDRLLGNRIQEFYLGLRKDFDDYDVYPLNARLGLMDMAFNLGNAGLIEKFPKFTDGAKKWNWLVCSKECYRRDVSDSRNDSTKKLFESLIS